MGANEDQLQAILAEGSWEVPHILPLEASLRASGRVVGDLSQVDPDTWSGATRAVMKELTELDSAIRAALEDLTAHDADLATSVNTVESFLDSAAEQPAPAQTTPVGGTGGGSYMRGPKA